jgi:hypothetical protein
MTKHQVSRKRDLKKLIAGVLLCLSANGWAAGAESAVAPDGGNGAPPVALLQRPAILPDNGAQTPTDELLLSLAHTANFNFLADATTPPRSEPKPTAQIAGPTSVPYGQAATLGILLDRLAEERRLTWRQEGQTLLFWPEPDLIAAARAITADETVSVSKPTPAKSPDMENELRTYLAKLPGWSELKPGDKRDVPLSQLPPELRDWVISQARNQVLDPEQMENWKAWLTDAFWQKAILQIQELNSPMPGGATHATGKPLTMLFVGGLVETPGRRGVTMMSIAKIETPLTP